MSLGAFSTYPPAGCLTVRTELDILQPEPDAEYAVVLHHRLIDHICREFLPVQDIEVHQVQVDGMGITGGVVDLPDLGVARAGFSVVGECQAMEPSIWPTRPTLMYAGVSGQLIGLPR